MRIAVVGGGFGVALAEAGADVIFIALELPWLGGEVVEPGRQLRFPTPTHSLIYPMLKPYIIGPAN